MSLVTDIGAFRGVQAFCREGEVELVVFPDKLGIASSLSQELEKVDGLVAVAPYLDQALSEQERLRACGWFGMQGNAADRPQVDLDNAAAGRLAARHLMELGLQRFVFVHNPLSERSWERFRGFREELESLGHPVAEFERGSRMPKGRWTAQDQLEDIVAFLPTVETPFGVFAYDDSHGLRVMEAARIKGLRVPKDLAVVATSAHHTACSFYTPSITTVINNMWDQGFESARLLVERLRGETQEFFRSCRPGGLVARGSTQISHAADPLVAGALDWLHQNPPSEWKVAAMSEALACSQMTLLRRFRAALGTTPKTVMQHRRVAIARRELVDTNDGFTEIAHRCGFADSAHFTRCIRDSTGQSPTEIRARLGSA